MEELLWLYYEQSSKISGGMDKIPGHILWNWLTKDLTKISKKQNQYLKWAGRSTTDAVKYWKMMNKMVNKLREAKNALFLHNLKPNSKDFWKAIKCLNCDTSSVPTLHKNGTMANSSSEKVTLLGQCFSQHFSLSESTLTPDDIPESDCSLWPSYLLCTEKRYC